MDIQTNRKAALIVATIALGFGTAYAIDSISNARFSLGVFFNSAQAQGHDSGGSKGGSGGSGGHDSGGHSGGKGGSSGHDSGSEHGGTEEKGHGTKQQHEGHSSGQHGSGSSHAGSERFGGGNGLHGNAQVPEGVGRYGEGASANNDQGRLRYWGGWTLPEGPDDPTTTDPVIATTTTDLVPGSGGGPSANARSALDGAARCEGVAAGMPPAQQFAGGNLLRLNAARGLVDPELAASSKIAPPFLMGSLQEELIKTAPNAELAGTYLGLIAKTPVTADTVKKIGFQLCARVGDAQAKEIADIAEAQRATLAAAAKANQ